MICALGNSMRRGTFRRPGSSPPPSRITLTLEYAARLLTLCLDSCALGRLAGEAGSHMLTIMAGTLMKLVTPCCSMRDSMLAASKAGWKTCTPNTSQCQSTAQQQKAARPPALL